MSKMFCAVTVAIFHIYIYMLEFLKKEYQRENYSGHNHDLIVLVCSLNDVFMKCLLTVYFIIY